MTPLSWVTANTVAPARTDFPSLQSGANLPQSRRAAHSSTCVGTAPPLDGFLTVIGRVPTTGGRAGGGEAGRKANFVSRGEPIAADSCP